MPVRVGPGRRGRRPPARRADLPERARRPVRPLPRDALLPRGALPRPRARVRRHSRRPGLRVVPALPLARPDTGRRHCTTTPIDDALEEFTGHRRIVGVLGGHAIEPRRAGVPGRRPARPRARRPAHRGHRRRARGDGGRQPRRLARPRHRRRPRGCGRDARCRSRASPRSRRGPAPRSRCASAGPRASNRSGCRPGSTATSRPTSSRARSRSTSATPPARTCSSASCRGGLVFLPGAAGTVQEMFQAACADYYAAARHRDPDGVRRPCVLDARAAGLGPAVRPRPRPGVRRRACISSTARRRCCPFSSRPDRGQASPWSSSGRRSAHGSRRRYPLTDVRRIRRSCEPVVVLDGLGHLLVDQRRGRAGRSR